MNLTQYDLTRREPRPAVGEVPLDWSSTDRKAAALSIVPDLVEKIG